MCDGKKDVRQIAGILSERLGAEISEEMVLFSLDELSNQNLLVDESSTEKYFAGISRRDAIRRIGLASMVALPLITAITMPMASHAASGLAGGSPCASNAECQSGFCTDSVCCNSSCLATSTKCNSPGTVGLCVFIPAGTDPDTECPSGPGLSGNCDGAGACA